MHRRSVVALAAAGLTRAAVAAEPFDVRTTYRNDRVDEAIRAAGEFLLSNAKSDGSIYDRDHKTAMTALAIMGLASIGMVPDLTDAKGRKVAAALAYVLDPQRRDVDGYFGNRDGSRMYGHGIVTLMLTEMLGMGVSDEQNKSIHAALVGGIELILAAQAIPKEPRARGGWRYKPDSRDSDLSISVWQLMALRSAKNDGLNVPGSAIESAVGYLKNSYAADRSGRRGNQSNEAPTGGFCYIPGSRSPTFTMTAAGLLAMQVCGRYDADEVRGSADFLLAKGPQTNDRFFYYGMYYYAQGMYQYGGRHAETARKRTAELLLPLQTNNGSFRAPGGQEAGVGAVYTTALALLALTVRYHYLPIYQR